MNIGLGLITFFHDLFTVVWIGGLLVLALTVIPSIRGVLGPGPELKKLMAAIQRQQSTWAYISMVGLILTGLLQARGNPAFTGLFTLGNPYSTLLTLKHALVIVMIGIALYRSLVLGRGKGSPSPSRDRLSASLLMGNAVLGVVVLLVSGLLSSIGVPGV